MNDDYPELDKMQAAYKAAVEEWITKIRREEELASVIHTAAEVDLWEQADMDEDEARDRVKTAKEAYEDALRKELFDF
ncbi:hypothetical protein PY365_19840 [Roseiarcaceae bacterium H3SJ34-1]|uniref:hypothetical protein n=1 Tax=Terripilifer ovatus TaxID=3032367 RepID=UPI003AB9A5D3|nr:hypothetical protein [Roseiarcaceae bacterium H3SJ34-1]